MIVLSGNPSFRGIDGLYKFVPLPLVQADADADTYVADAIGDAGTNLTGAGAGLTGADVVLTQYGSVGTDGTNRVITDGAAQAFSATLAWANNFAQSAAGFSYILRTKNLNGANRALANLLAFDAAGDRAFELMFAQREVELLAKVGSAKSTDGIGAGIFLSYYTDAFPQASTAYQFISSLDYVNGLAFMGIRVDDGAFPFDLTDFIFSAFNPFGSAYSGPNAATTFTSAFGYINSCPVGQVPQSPGTPAGQTVVSIIASKKPCFVPR
jgi:hypothetical protein